MLPYNRNLKQHSRQLREHMTDAERHLWSKVRMKQLKGYQFYRQKPIGDYIVDFFCPKAKLVIEVDGSQHFFDEINESDRIRSEYLSSLGLRVLRFTNTDVLTEIKRVVESIIENMGIIGEDGKEYLHDIWFTGLKFEFDALANKALDHCKDATEVCIGKIEADIKTGIRDEQGKVIGKPQRTNTEHPKTFIAHGGKSEARDKLCRFLTALGVTPFIIEEEPKEGRSVNEQVEYYSEQADCAIILGTADDKELKDGKLYPGRNVHIEIGRFQEKFSNRIIYLLQEGASFPSDISEKLSTRFTHENMDEAFITVARELKLFGLIKPVKPNKEQKT